MDYFSSPFQYVYIASPSMSSTMPIQAFPLYTPATPATHSLTPIKSHLHALAP